ncbi:hypothetical protein TNCV_4952311 [Trichonephila clavipes]|nr:hypothetical protein TNCV_4952311 [Trichonephila clavipes]
MDTNHIGSGSDKLGTPSRMMQSDYVMYFLLRFYSLNHVAGVHIRTGGIHLHPPTLSRPRVWIDDCIQGMFASRPGEISIHRAQ